MNLSEVMSCRAQNVLRLKNITTIEELYDFAKANNFCTGPIRVLRNCGKQTMQEIVDVLYTYCGVQLGGYTTSNEISRKNSPKIIDIPKLYGPARMKILQYFSDEELETEISIRKEKQSLSKMQEILKISGNKEALMNLIEKCDKYNFWEDLKKES